MIEIREATKNQAAEIARLIMMATQNDDLSSKSGRLAV